LPRFPFHFSRDCTKFDAFPLPDPSRD
jgi:hypothetical protein